MGAINEVDFARVLSPIRVSGNAAIALAARIEVAAPEDLSEAEKKALRRVVRASGEVKSVLLERDRVAPSKVRAAFEACRNYWSAIYEALSAASRVAAITRRNAEAATLIATLFAEGLEFVKLDADALWAESSRRLRRIADDGLADSIEALIGKQYLDAVKKGTSDLAQAVGIAGERKVAVSSTALSEALSKFTRAVGAYQRAMAAEVEDEDSDSVARFLEAMAPIEAARVTRAGAVTEEEVIEPTPAEPVAPVLTPSEPAAGESEPIVQPADA